jgi:hypothetical protein
MPLDTANLLAQDDVKAFFISHLAMEVIGEMFTHTRAVAEHFGTDSAEYRAQVDSLMHCLRAVLTRTGFGNRMSITKDGDLSLYCDEDRAFVFGMVWFRDRAHDDAPVQPGTWSLHS